MMPGTASIICGIAAISPRASASISCIAAWISSVIDSGDVIVSTMPSSADIAAVMTPGS